MTSQKPFQIIYQIHNTAVSEAIKFKNSAIETETVNLTSDSDDEVKTHPESSISCEEVAVSFNDVEDKFEVIQENEQHFETDVEQFRSSENDQLPKLMRIEDVRSLHGNKRKADEFLEEVQLPKLFRINPVHYQSGTKTSQQINYNMTVKVKDGHLQPEIPASIESIISSLPKITFNRIAANESTSQLKSSDKSSSSTIIKPIRQNLVIKKISDTLNVSF